MEDTAALGTTRTLAESESQRCDPIFSPPHWMVPAITRVHVYNCDPTALATGHPHICVTSKVRLHLSPIYGGRYRSLVSRQWMLPWVLALLPGPACANTATD